MLKLLKTIGEIGLGLLMLGLTLNLVAILLAPPPPISGKLFSLYLFIMLYYQTY